MQQRTHNELKNKDILAWGVAHAQRERHDRRINRILMARPRQRSHMHDLH